MEIYSRSQVVGNHVSLNTTQNTHISDKPGVPKSDDPVKPFAEVFLNAVDHVNGLQTNASDMEQELIYNPDQVNVHEVMIASEKARLSLTMLKTLTDKALKAYNDIMMIR